MEWLKYIVAAITAIVAGWSVKILISNRSTRLKRTTIVSQKNNRAGGDIVGGDMNKNSRE